MPLLRFDVFEGRTPGQLQDLLDATHDAVVAAFAVPVRDRYQIVQQHAPAHMILEDTGLGITRSARAVSIAVTSRPRTREQKQEFYRLVCANLEARCGIPSSDVIISIVENADDDWSFGYGRAQFVTGEL
jgi:phenylpyruvate tautomerase PptA (4-oxalocrotonate tautomerase family)